MSSKDFAGQFPSPGLTQEIQNRMLDETHKVGQKAIDRLRQLSNELPSGVVEQIERLHGDPARERRMTSRVSDSSIPISIHAVGLPRAAGGTAMINHCPAGMAILLPYHAEVGTLLSVRIPLELGAGGWVTVEVRYCRKEGPRWVAGCELLDDQRPI
jgi:hypothetical protein